MADAGTFAATQAPAPAGTQVSDQAATKAATASAAKTRNRTKSKGNGSMELVFMGECLKGCDPLTVRHAVAAALKLDAQRTARLFSGKPVVLKRRVDIAYAMRQVTRFATMGAVLRAQPMPAAAPAGPQAARPTKTWVRWPQGPGHRLVLRSLALAGLSLVLVGAFVQGQRWGQDSTTAAGPASFAGSATLSAAGSPAQLLAAAVVAPVGPTHVGTAALAAPVRGGSGDDELISRLSAQAAQDYKLAYLAAKWHKSFAISDSGAHAWVTDVDTEDQARDTALVRCMQRSGADPCRVVDVNGQQLE